jgi:hypothetical protein
MGAIIYLIVCFIKTKSPVNTVQNACCFIMSLFDFIRRVGNGLRTGKTARVLISVKEKINRVHRLGDALGCL